MTFNTFMPPGLKPYFDGELQSYRQRLKSGHWTNAWSHLERAHVMGQRYPFAHSYVHWEMLKFGIRIKSFREITGQIPRLLLGGVKSFVGKVPVGNPGGAKVSPLKTFPIDDDIQEIFRRAGVNPPRA